MHNVSKSCMSKGPFKVQDRSVDFNSTEYEKHTDMVSDSTLQRTFKKLPLVSFGAVSKKNIYNYV